MFPGCADRAAADRAGGPCRIRAPRSAGALYSAVVDQATEDTGMDNARVQQLERQQDRVIELRGYL